MNNNNFKYKTKYFKLKEMSSEGWDIRVDFNVYALPQIERKLPTLKEMTIKKIAEDHLEAREKEIYKNNK